MLYCQIQGQQLPLSFQTILAPLLYVHGPSIPGAYNGGVSIPKPPFHLQVYASLGGTASHSAGQEMEENNVVKSIQGVCCILDDSMSNTKKSNTPLI